MAPEGVGHGARGHESKVEIDFDVTDLELIVFDKDGTLIDFHATWGPAVHETLSFFATDARQLAAAAEAVDFDLDNQRILDGSPIVAESNAEIIARLQPVMPSLDAEQFDRVGLEASLASLQPLPAVGEALVRLRERGVVLAVATNDAEQAARRQLDELGWLGHFTAIVGYNSGYGAKPAPGMVVAAAELALKLDGTEVAHSRTAMVGDSAHDIDAGRAAGFRTVYVGVDPAVARTADMCMTSVADLR